MRFMDLGPAELILIVVALVLVFGAGKIGDIGGALGRSVREFRQASQDDPEEPASEAVAATVENTPENTPEVTTTSPPTIGDYRPQT
jgi:sec-independent protein translocase protein TatA